MEEDPCLDLPPASNTQAMFIHHPVGNSNYARCGLSVATIKTFISDRDQKRTYNSILINPHTYPSYG